MLLVAVTNPMVYYLGASLLAKQALFVIVYLRLQLVNAVDKKQAQNN